MLVVNGILLTATAAFFCARSKSCESCEHTSHPRSRQTPEYFALRLWLHSMREGALASPARDWLGRQGRDGVGAEGEEFWFFTARNSLIRRVISFAFEVCSSFRCLSGQFRSSELPHVLQTYFVHILQSTDRKLHRVALDSHSISCRFLALLQ